MINHKNAHFVVVEKEETKETMIVLAEHGDLAKLENELSEFGASVAAIRPTFEERMMERHRKTFDLLCLRSDRSSEDSEVTLLERLFLVAFEAGREHERKKLSETMAKASGEWCP